MPTDKYPAGLMHSIDAMNDDQMPDGAWWAMLEEAVQAYNERNNTDFDETASVHAYLKWNFKGKK